MKRSFKGTAKALAAVGMAVLLGGGYAQAQEVFKIGVVGPLTGPAATSGIPLQRSMIIAVEEANQRGGVTIGGKKKKVELIFEDSQSKPAVGVSATEKLISRDNVNMIIGDLVHSSVAMAMMDLSALHELPFFSMYPTAKEISDRIRDDRKTYSRFWKGMFNTDAYSRAIHQSVKHLIATGGLKPGKKTIAFVLEDTDFGKSVARFTEPLFKQDGWTVVATESVPIGYTDFYPQLSKLKSLAPDVVVSGFTALNSGVALARQYAELAPKSLHLGVFYPELPAFRGQVGEAAEGMMWVPTYVIPPEFVERVKKRWGVDAVGHDYTFGYDLMNVAMSALDKAGATDTDSMRKGFLAVDHKGISGRWVFDADSQTAKDGPEFLPIMLGQVQNGKPVVIWPENRAAGTYKPQPWIKN